MPSVSATVVKADSALGPNILAAGIAGAAVEAAVRHCRERGMEEWISHQLGPMSDRLKALRCYNYFAARALRTDCDREMTMAHIEVQRIGGEDGPWICDRAMEIMGGSSYMRGSPIQRYPAMPGAARSSPSRWTSGGSRPRSCTRTTPWTRSR